METTLTGTERQITWAQNIKTEFERTLWAEVEEANERVKTGDMPPVWAAAVYDATVALQSSIDKDAHGMAKFWIEQRNRIMGFAKRTKELATKQCPDAVLRPALDAWRQELGLTAL